MSLFLQAQALGVQQVNSLISTIDHELKQGLRERLKEASQLIAERMKAETHSRQVKSAITYEVQVNSLTDFVARIGPLRKKAWFAHFLEFGTVHSRAFPFALPTIDALEERIVELVGIPPILSIGKKADITAAKLTEAGITFERAGRVFGPGS